MTIIVVFSFCLLCFGTEFVLKLWFGYTTLTILFFREKSKQESQSRRWLWGWRQRQEPWRRRWRQKSRYRICGSRSQRGPRSRQPRSIPRCGHQSIWYWIRLWIWNETWRRKQSTRCRRVSFIHVFLWNLSLVRSADFWQNTVRHKIQINLNLI